jgi:hypothetical protein
LPCLVTPAPLVLMNSSMGEVMAAAAHTRHACAVLALGTLAGHASTV